MNKKQFNTIEELYHSFPWKSQNKFVPLAKRYGFSEQEAKQFLRKNVVHDVKVPKAEFMPIVSKYPNGYQMDTFINEKKKGGLNYLMLININTRKAYAYPLTGKGSKSVLDALTKFFNEVVDVHSITSDQDTAYLSNDVLDFFKSKNIIYKTTEDNNHNVLGIINRFMRTIRDVIGENRYIDEKEMNDLIDSYNNSPHKSLNNKAPNDITKEDELNYIQMKTKINPYDFETNDRVRIILANEPFSKKRNKVSKESYIVDSKSGNQFLVKAKDDSVDKLPGYRLIKSANNIPLANSLKNGKRGIVEKIMSYDEKTNKYRVQYEGGVKDTIPAKNLREGNPINLSQMELEYWSKQKYIPDTIKKWA